jgi:ketosteroid isomerase-like protein
MTTYRPLLIILFLMPLFNSCSKDTEKDKVKKVVTGVHHAAEEKKISAVLDYISKSYHDSQGNDYNAVKDILAYNFFRHQKVSVYIPNIDVVVSGSTAQVMFQAVMTGRETGGGDILPEALGTYNFEVHLSKEDGTWKITSAMWEPTGDATGPPQ